MRRTVGVDEILYGASITAKGTAYLSVRSLENLSTHQNEMHPEPVRKELGDSNETDL